MAVLLALIMMSLASSGGAKTVSRGTLSGIERPRLVVVRSESDWRALWKEHAPDQDVPRVDFTTRTVLAVFLGSRNTAGFEVEITGLEGNGHGMTVRYRESRPGRDQMLAQIITTPFHIVSVPRIDGPVTFVKDDGN